jgi:hypothetical protein
VRHRAEGLNSSITALAGMVGDRQGLKGQGLSLREARNAKALSFLGILFIPLAYSGSLFSMSDPYGPGGEKFWVYLAISCPLIVLVACLYIGYDTAGSHTGWLVGLGAQMMKGH